VCSNSHPEKHPWFCETYINKRLHIELVQPMKLQKIIIKHNLLPVCNSLSGKKKFDKSTANFTA
jgi:hypothetical protein